MKLIKHVTASERAYVEIKSMIARRELPPGAPLILQSLADRLGVSRTPIVEAIRRLERDGLVQVAAQWGATVKEWSREEMEEAYVIRRALEGEAARYFVLRARPEDKKRLVELSDLFDKFAISNTIRCDELDIELHLHIARSTGLPRLYELIENSKTETAIIAGLAFASIDDPEERKSLYASNVGCHKPLVKALSGKDPEKAKREVFRHIDTNLNRILKLEEKKEQAKRRVAG